MDLCHERVRYGSELRVPKKFVGKKKKQTETMLTVVLRAMALWSRLVGCNSQAWCFSVRGLGMRWSGSLTIIGSAVDWYSRSVACEDTRRGNNLVWNPNTLGPPPVPRKKGPSTTISQPSILWVGRSLTYFARSGEYGAPYLNVFDIFWLCGGLAGRCCCFFLGPND